MGSVTLSFNAGGSSYSATATVPPVAGVTAPLLSPLKLSMLRACLPVGYKITGIDTQVGCVAPPGGLTLASTIPLRNSTNATGLSVLTTSQTVEISTGINGLTFTNYDFRGYSVVNWGQNVSFVNCLFDFTGPAAYVIQNNTGVKALSLTNCSFVGSFAAAVPPTGPDVIAISGFTAVTTVSNCLFQEVPSHAIHLAAGSVTGCYFNGLANIVGTHADAISVPCTCAPVTISGNTIDGTWWNAADVLGNENSGLYIRTDGGDNVMGVTVTNNVIMGGANGADVQQSTISYLVSPFTGTLNAQGALNNISITNNYFGFWVANEFYPITAAIDPTIGTNIVLTPNVNVDYSNPQWSAAAWAAYPNKANVLYSGVPLGHLYGVTTKPNIFVGGFGGQYITTATGQPSVFVYLNPGDSQPQHPDLITGFNVATDVLDLSALGTLTYIGAGTPTGDGQVSTAVVSGDTVVSVYMPGSYYPDMQIKLAGAPVLTAANFVL
jgi:hypothetical protein